MIIRELNILRKHNDETVEKYESQDEINLLVEIIKDIFITEEYGV